MVINTSNGGHQLVANPGIWGAQALKNRSVAVSRFGPGTYLLSQALAAEGLPLQRLCGAYRHRPGAVR